MKPQIVSHKKKKKKKGSMIKKFQRYKKDNIRPIKFDFKAKVIF